MNLLSKKIGLKAQKDLCAFNFTQIKALGRQLFRASHDGIDKRAHIITEIISFVDDL